MPKHLDHSKQGVQVVQPGGVKTFNIVGVEGSIHDTEYSERRIQEHLKIKSGDKFDTLQHYMVEELLVRSMQEPDKKWMDTQDILPPLNSEEKIKTGEDLKIIRDRLEKSKDQPNPETREEAAKLYMGLRKRLYPEIPGKL